MVQFIQSTLIPVGRLCFSRKQVTSFDLKLPRTSQVALYMYDYGPNSYSVQFTSSPSDICAKFEESPQGFPVMCLQEWDGSEFIKI